MSAHIYVEGSPSVNFGALFERIWQGRWWLLASVVVFTAGFTAAAYMMTPMYQATSVLVPATPEQGSGGSAGSALGQLGGLASLAGINLGSNASQVEESLAVMRSRELTERFIKEKDLMPQLLPKRWDAAGKRWKGEQKTWPSLAQAFQYFDSQVRTVTLDKKTGLVKVTIEWSDPQLAASWANDLVDRLNAEMRARAIRSTNASVGYLERELGTTNAVETRQAISRLMEAQINRRMLANVTEEYALRVVDRALPPDSRYRSSPNRLLLISVGPVLGLIFGVIAVLLAAAISAYRSSGRAQ